MHPLSVECHTVQAFSVASDFNPKEKNQVTNRKVCTVIQSLVSHLPNHLLGHSEDHEKHYTFLTFPKGLTLSTT